MTITTASTIGVQGKTRIDIHLPGPRGWVERKATFEDAGESLVYGVSPTWYEKYKVVDGQFPIRATTNDVFAASIASCLTGVFSAALEARGIEVSPNTLYVDVFTDMGPLDDDPVWIVRSIRLVFHLKVEDSQRAAAERAVATYDRNCLLSQTMKGSRCEITSELVFV